MPTFIGIDQFQYSQSPDGGCGAQTPAVSLLGDTRFESEAGAIIWGISSAG